MFYLLLLIPFFCAILLSFAARMSTVGLKGLALHPFNILGILLNIIALDFFVLYGDLLSNVPTRFSAYSIDGPGAVLSGMLFFCLCAIALTAGILIPVFGERPPPEAPKRKADVPPRAARAAKTLLFLAIALLLFITSEVVVQSLQRGNLLYVAGVRQTFFRNNQILYLLYGLCVPAFFIYGAMHKFGKNTLLAAAVFCTLLIPLGSRGLLVYILLGLSYWWAMERPLPLPLLYAAAPILGIGAVVYRFFARDAYSFPTLSAFLDAKGGFFGVLFRTPDISFAEAITVAVNYVRMNRAPWDSLLGAVAAPFPRAIFPWKPAGASAQFTAESTPEYWALIKSEKTVTGFSNLLFDFGYVGALVSAFVLGLAWCSYVRSRNIGYGSAFVGPVGIVCIYIFCRGDIYNLALFVWPTLLAGVLFTLLSRMRTARSAPNAPTVGFRGSK